MPTPTPRRRRRIPGICYHKAARRYYVTLDGRETYLSEQMPKQPSPPAEVKREYDRILATWLAARSTCPVPVANDPTVDELWLGYLGHCQTYYRKGGKVTSEVACIKDACRIAARLFGELPARSFGPKQLKAVRQAFIDAGWTLSTVNKQTSRVRRMFRWAVAEELVAETVHRALQAVPDLRDGEQGLSDPEPIEDVPDEVIEATLPRLPRSLQDLVRAHRLIGCRAQEICAARTRDFDLQADSDDVPAEKRCWLFTPLDSKTGESYWVGPRAQAILRPLLQPERPDAWLFPTRRRGRGCWTTASYRRAVGRACRREPALPHWSPLQIRHAAAEEARRKHVKGIEAVQSRLRHKDISVSQQYAHNRDTLGRDVARQLG